MSCHGRKKAWAFIEGTTSSTFWKEEKSDKNGTFVGEERRSGGPSLSQKLMAAYIFFYICRLRFMLCLTWPTSGMTSF